MPYNQELEFRIEKLLSRFGDISKKKMFGGICYLLNGNMCFGIYKEYLIIRTSEEKAKELLKSEDIKVFDITGRPMKGWVMVSLDHVETDAQLETMLKISSDFVKNLPKK
jgi:hypothetical protein